ncbi:MAG: DUF1127 domain-containing protein [Proteobacteria bacterium]|nr:DUF1127 domain-containing protein [Pseudomonadota bacterium]
MTYMTSSAASAPLASGGIAAGFAGILGAISNHFRVRRSMNELRALSPESLRDIGIERSEIERVVQFGRVGY